MRLILRIVGTWFVGMAMIYLIIDGTKSLAASQAVVTKLGDGWDALSPGSLAATRAFFDSRFFGPLLDPLFTGLLSLPAFAVLAVPGIVLLILGRSRRRGREFVRQDQF